MFLRGVLDRILTMHDLAGISRNRKKPTVVTGRQPLASDESSPLQRIKRKVQPNLGAMNSQRLIHLHRWKRSLYEESDSLSNERPSLSPRYVQSYTYESICTPLPKKYPSSDHKIAGKERTRTFKNLLVEDDIFPHLENTSSYYQDGYNMGLSGVDDDEIHDSESSEIANDIQGDVRSSPWSSRDYRSSLNSTSLRRSSSNYTPNLNLGSREMNWNKSHTRLPTSIVFRGLKDGSAKQSMAMPTYIYPVEEPTVYGTLFEQADPWDAIGQILGLSNTKPSKVLGELINELGEIDEELINERSEINESETSLGTRSVIVETEETPSQSPQLSYVRNDVEEIAQGSEDDQDYSIEEKQLFPPTQIQQDTPEVLKSPDRIKTAVVEFAIDSLECSATEEAICNGESKSVLSVPELQELDGLFMGPSLFDEDEDEI
ncbi:hypothetical protein BYT27DRAFT_7131428 [Phlegmacium glaucopus]|nr:hypothetical protein BYT27DRAFT_7131428 [Phlegmacium glaucopus]